MSKTTKIDITTTADAPPTEEPKAAPVLLAYEVTAPEIKIGGVKAYCTAIVRLTEDRAEALLKVMPGSLRLLGLA